MGKIKSNVTFSTKHIDESLAIDKALEKVSENLIAEEKARDGYLVVSDKEGNIKKIPAKDL